jgi:hypothetical protein
LKVIMEKNYGAWMSFFLFKKNQTLDILKVFPYSIVRNYLSSFKIKKRVTQLKETKGG